MPEGEPSKKKRSKFKTIDIDTEEVALILKYDVEVVLTTAEGESTVESRQSNQTKIRVKTLSETSNIEKIARQISDKCKQIPPAKVPLVITKLYELQMAVTGKGGGGSSTASPAAGTASAGSSPDNAAAERVAQEQRSREREEQEEAAAKQRREREEADRREREEADRREREEADRREREEAQQREREKQEAQDRAELEEAAAKERQEEIDRHRERDRADYEGLQYDDVGRQLRGHDGPSDSEGGRDLGAWEPVGPATGWGSESPPSQSNGVRAEQTREREKERERQKAERERKQREYDEEVARQQKEREEAEAERMRQKELQRQWAEQRHEDFELQREDELERKKEEAQMEKIRKQMDKVSFEKLDSYIEFLYEETEQKVKGTHRILLLARNPDHLEDLLQNETLLGVICRLFREDSRKSIDLVTNIAYIFYSFSVYSKFHAEISQHRVGDLAMRIVEGELDRSPMIAKDVADVEAKLRTVEKGSRDEEKLNKEMKKIRTFNRKQDKLLIVCLHILLNLAEDPKVEKKMKKRKIVERLLQVLERRNLELRQLAIMFLKKLSIFKENKDEMAKLGIVQKLSKFVPQDHQPLLNAALRLLSNLAFDAELRKAMVEHDFPPKLVEVFKRARGPVAELTLRVLYQISMEESARQKFRFTECIPLVMQLLLHQTDPSIDRTAVALAINLSLHQGTAEALGDKGQLRQLMSRALQSMDNCLLKLVRNISMHSQNMPLKAEFRDHMDMLLQAAVQMTGPDDNHDALVEILGIFANMSPKVCDIENLVLKYDLVNWLNKFLLPGFAQDDIVLEVIMAIGVIATEPKCAPMIANSRLISGLRELFDHQKEDDEMVLQLVYTFYCLIRAKETRDAILGSNDHLPIVELMIDMLQDKHEAIRRIAGNLLDVVMEVSEEWAQKIKLRKFETYNQEWMRAIEDDEQLEAYYETGDGYDEMTAMDRLGHQQEMFESMGRWDDDPSMMGMGQAMDGMDPMMLQNQMMRERMYMEEQQRQMGMHGGGEMMHDYYDTQAHPYGFS